MKNLVIWLIGSNSSGKTTQARLLHEQFQTCDKKIVNFNQSGVDTFYTDFGLIANLGKVSDNQCTGTDTLNKKVQVEYAFNRLIEIDKPIIVVDGILATYQWQKFIFQPDNYHKLVFFLNFSSLENNIRRVRQRRYNKTGIDKDLDEKTCANLRGKIVGFTNLYNKLKKGADQAVEIDADLSIHKIHQRISNVILEVYYG